MVKMQIAPWKKPDLMQRIEMGRDASRVAINTAIVPKRAAELRMFHRARAVELREMLCQRSRMGSSEYESDIFLKTIDRIDGGAGASCGARAWRQVRRVEIKRRDIALPSCTSSPVTGAGNVQVMLFVHRDHVALAEQAIRDIASGELLTRDGAGFEDVARADGKTIGGLEETNGWYWFFDKYGDIFRKVVATFRNTRYHREVSRERRSYRSGSQFRSK